MTSPTQTSNSGGLGSLRLTSSLAAAVLSGVGHPPLPGMFKWDAAKFEEEIKREKRIRRKQKVIEKEQEKADKIKYSRMKDVYINRTVDFIRSQIYYYNNRSKKISKHHVLSYNINMQNNLNSTRFVQYHNDQLITEIENLSYDMLFNIFLNFQENVTEAVKSGGWDGKDETTIKISQNLLYQLNRPVLTYEQTSII
ncbi:hypothetical protein HELRODRAFT_168276 [Helobdella robusta]|uniref:Uncharacterized protein n=1 Tax=Helobdella robusta TaxID=6412 RepID=T1F0E1_HELRO|nr:hypothetical protein HELRODRAFT_168276 [Helobdella robusta]ESO09312.1 hypothetical protein HELRODRAFT_168276 [Helobdella robusta]